MNLSESYKKRLNELSGLNESPKLKPKPILRKVLTQAEIIKMGGNYHVQHGMYMYIPVNQVDGLDPTPATWYDDEGNDNEFKKGVEITKPIEVWYDLGQDLYMLHDGNHRMTQAKLNGDKYIKAFVQADKEMYNKWMSIK